jgi:hypothetical protein
MQIWGQAAAPVGTSGVLGANGSASTCTAQGLLLQFGFAGPSYYAALSIFSFVAVRNNFKIENMLRIERFIHIGVFIYPVISSYYLLSIEAFNYVGPVCWIASSPMGCGDGSNIVCQRGPQNIIGVAVAFGAIPVALVLILPTIVMAFLYYEVGKRQDLIIDASTVARQALLYLLALYWSCLFTSIHLTLLIVYNIYIFPLCLIGVIVGNLQGLWILLVYLGFNRTPKDIQLVVEQLPSSGEVRSKESGKDSSKKSEESFEDKYKSSIFDGTNSCSKFQNFIFEGEDEDIKKDKEESLYWDDVIQC